MQELIQIWTQKIESVLQEAEERLKSVNALEALENQRLHFLGRKGVLTEYLKELGKIPPEDRPHIGKMIHTAKEKIEGILTKAEETLGDQATVVRLKAETVDVALPGWTRALGSLHPITQVTKEIVQAFLEIGFCVHEGPEIETDYYNFEALNIPKDHPARDMQDTLYVSEDLLLRTHTSPIQIHVMKEHQPPLKVIAPGRVYRSDDVDVSHSPMFHQIEGFMVDREVTFAQLKYVLTLFAKRLFGEKARLRFRPSFFPFTEPSAEVDIACSVCEGAGCRVCSSRGWLEVLGAGMVHPRVFEAVGYDPENVTGFAFGMGVERIAMLKYGINDIRHFYESDVRFLRQF